MKFNIFNWLLETVGTVLVFFNKHKFVTVLYILVISVGTPLVYYMGIEENRNDVKRIVSSKITIRKETSASA